MGCPKVASVSSAGARLLVRVAVPRILVDLLAIALALRADSLRGTSALLFGREFRRCMSVGTHRFFSSVKPRHHKMEQTLRTSSPFQFSFFVFDSKFYEALSLLAKSSGAFLSLAPRKSRALRSAMRLWHESHCAHQDARRFISARACGLRPCGLLPEGDSARQIYVRHKAAAGVDVPCEQRERRESYRDCRC